jgi:hypothetical protein
MTGLSFVVAFAVVIFNRNQFQKLPERRFSGKGFSALIGVYSCRLKGHPGRPSLRFVGSVSRAVPRARPA